MTISQPIWYPKSVKERWPKPLASEWRAAYPELFDVGDARIARSEPDRHFYEWYAAIHLQMREGVYSLIEKYAFDNHAAKVATLDQLLGARAGFLRNFREHTGVQPPDLLVFSPDLTKRWFVEVKGPTDALTAAQTQSHAVIESQLGMVVEVLRIREL